MPTVINHEMIKATYLAAKKVYAETIKENDAFEDVVQNTNMSKGSAQIYISTVIKMLKGKPYDRTIKVKAVDYFLKKIYHDYSRNKFTNALHSVRKHLENNDNPQKNVWEVLSKHEKILNQPQNFILPLPEEIVDNKILIEGAKKQITNNAYERNPKARAKCIDHHGLCCKVCNFNFEETYGEIGKGYIQVHHLKPLSEIQANYEVDPIYDLVPVCSNCHAMLHRRNPPYSTDDLRNSLNN